MVKIIFFIIISVSSFLSAKSQTRDSTICDKYFEWMDSEEAQLTTLWSQAPQLKGTNMSLLSELCDLLTADSCKSMIVTLILDKYGHVICFKVYPELVRNLLNNEMINLLYRLEFNPAMQNNTPVISHFGLMINAQKCEFYRNINVQKRKWKKIFTL
jgi:hypothetical protein